MRIIVLVFVGVFAAVASFFLVQRLVGGSDIFPPQQGSTVEGAKDIAEEWREDRIEQASIDLDAIRSGGPRKDGIPSLDHPAFVTTAQADVNEDFDDDGFGLSVTVEDETRFYPYQILVWHEIVNDTIGDTPLLVTYCPLCFTGIVLDRSVDLPDGSTQALEFGVSGLLYDNNLLMYNRVLEKDDPPETLWSQAQATAVAGPLTGTQLNLWPQAETVQWGEWKKAHPSGSVLSRDTGYLRNYDSEPYGDYFDRDNSRLLFPLSHDDDRLLRKEIVEGVAINGETKAYVRSALSAQAPVEDTLGGVAIVWRKDGKTGALRLFDKETGERIGVAESFWFSWVATHPDTKVWP